MTTIYVTVAGPTGAGKSDVISLMKEALSTPARNVSMLCRHQNGAAYDGDPFALQVTDIKLFEQDRNSCSHPWAEIKDLTGTNQPIETGSVWHDTWAERPVYYVVMGFPREYQADKYAALLVNGITGELVSMENQALHSFIRNGRFVRVDAVPEPEDNYRG